MRERKDIELLLKKFLKKSPRKDDEVHAFAEKAGIDPHDLEGMIYSIAFKALNGRYLKHWDVPDDKFDPDELAMGVEIELEHTGDRKIAEVIAKAHLLELPDYYTRLKKMENESDFAEWCEQAYANAKSLKMMCESSSKQGFFEKKGGKLSGVYFGNDFDHKISFDYVSDKTAEMLKGLDDGVYSVNYNPSNSSIENVAKIDVRKELSKLKKTKSKIVKFRTTQKQRFTKSARTRIHQADDIRRRKIDWLERV